MADRHTYALSSFLWIVFAAIPGLALPGSASGAGPLKVYVLAGQSNMQGHAHVRTIDAMALDRDTAVLLERMKNPNGSARVCEDVWISSTGSSPEPRSGRLTVGYGANPDGSKIGPELAFGLTLEEELDEPILIIKTAWGGRSLHTDFRPPSAGPFVFTPEQRGALAHDGQDPDAAQAERAAASGRSYRAMMSHIHAVLADIGAVYPDYDPRDGFVLSGFVWFQGWNDMVDRDVYPDRNSPGGFDEYRDLLATLIRDVRLELETPDLPFVIGVMGVGGPVDLYPPDEERYAPTHRNFRAAMAAPASMPEFAGTVAAVRTESCWDSELMALQQRERNIQPQIDAIRAAMDDGSLSRVQGSSNLECLDAEHFSPRERILLRQSTSDAAYHYLGSARIVGRIGRAFARSVIDLTRERALASPSPTRSPR